MTDIDTSAAACAVACMLVSNPAGELRSVGWQKRVNDLIRALRDERDQARTALATERKDNVRWQRNAEAAHKKWLAEGKRADKLREALERAREAIAPIASLVAATADGFPDHDICPIRLGQARALADAFAVIREVLTETGDRDD